MAANTRMRQWERRTVQRAVSSHQNADAIAQIRSCESNGRNWNDSGMNSTDAGSAESRGPRPDKNRRFSFVGTHRSRQSTRKSTSIGAPGRTRTCDARLRKPAAYARTDFWSSDLRCIPHEPIRVTGLEHSEGIERAWRCRS